VNAKPLLEILARRSERKENPQAPNPFDPHIDRLIATSGLTGLKSVALSFENENDGCSFRLFLGLPEEGRQGIFKVITGEPKESSPPAFVPADAVKFQRWRLNTPKAWNALETMRGDVAWINTLGFILEAANANARLKDPSLDIKPALLGNLGNDIITYEKAAHGNSAADRENPPAIMLVGCQRADQVSAALKSVFGLLNQGASATEREFLGRKIFSVPLPQLPLPMAETSRPQIPRALNYI
jgi:hypothetical protein